MTQATQLHVQDNQPSVSEVIWGFHWQDFLPCSLTPDIHLDRVSYLQAEKFIQEFFPEIYHLHESQKVYRDATPQAVRERYYRKFGDFFLLQDNQQQPVGMAIGSMLDWSSYNFRNIAIRPEYQGLGLYPKFTAWLFETLSKVGVSRIEGDVSPSNLQHVHILNKMGYHVTGLQLSDRWGAVVHITKFLDEEPKNIFYDGFCNTAASDRHQQSMRKKPKRA